MSRPPRWGCSHVAHERLGWCAHCPGVNLMAEVCAWRLLADGHLGADYDWALRLTAEAS